MISFVASNKKEVLPYGICHLDDDGKFSNIKEKHYSNFLINVGLYLIEPEIIDDAYYRVFRTADNFDVIPFGTGTL